MMKEIEVEGKTIEEAINKALTELKATADEVEIKIINEGKAGLFGLMGAVPARVRAILKETSIEKNELVKRAKNIVDNILAKMNVDGDTSVEVQEQNVVVNIDSLEGALLIGKKGQTLEAFQYIVNLIINKEIKAGLIKGVTLEDKYKLIVDTEGYRSRREESLVKMANNLAEKVKKTRKKVELEPMSSHDRRVIHLALQEVRGIRTESEGEGALRRIIIYPTEN